MKHLISIIVFLLLCNNSNAQLEFDKSKVSTEVLKIADSIAEYRRHESRDLGEAGYPSKQYERFENLRNTASIEELVELTKHPSGVVRVYAFEGLPKDSSIDRVSIALQHIHDTTTVYTMWGCMGDPKMTGDIIMIFLGRENIEDTLKYSQGTINACLDALEKEPKIKIDSFLKKLTTEENADILFLYKAIQRFPNDDLFPYLQKKLDEELNNNSFNNAWQDMYKAIWAYQNELSASLLEKALSFPINPQYKSYHVQCIHNAVRRSSTSAYDHIRWRLWEEYGKYMNCKYTNLAKKI
jgi:hypothetical protein